MNKDLAATKSATPATAAGRPSISVARLVVWTVRDQAAEAIMRRGAALVGAELAADGMEPRRASGCGAAWIAGGGVPMGGARRWCGGEDLHPDAEAVWRMIEHVPPLVAYGRSALAPLGQACATPRCHMLSRDQAAMTEATADMVVGLGDLDAANVTRHGFLRSRTIRDRHGNARGHWIRFAPDPATIAMHRRAYAAWWRALADLRADLVAGAVLTRWRLDDAMPPPAPWLGQVSKAIDKTTDY